MIILKIGGSIITKKDSKTPILNENIVQNVSKQIKEYLDETNDKLIIVHGAGSFGHPFAKKYNIGKPIMDNIDLESKKYGFCLTQSWVKKLNSMICDSLRMEKIPIVSVHPSSFIITYNKRVCSGSLKLLSKYLDNYFVPVLYGDVVLDRNNDIKMSVISGDQIISYIAKNLKPERVILSTDVDGVYTKNPKLFNDAELIEELNSLDDLESLDSTTNIDVTGGMIGKIKELISLSELGIESYIINANKNDNIKKALYGDVEGTLIKQ